MKVLLIEDNDGLRATLVDHLLDLGIEADGLASAEDALVLLSAGQVPDVLVTDIDLGPGLDGVNLADMARAKHPQVRIVFITGATAEQAEQRRGPADRLLIKPFDFQQLADAILDGQPARD